MTAVAALMSLKAQLTSRPKLSEAMMNATKRTRNRKKLAGSGTSPKQKYTMTMNTIGDTFLEKKAEKAEKKAQHHSAGKQASDKFRMLVL